MKHLALALIGALTVGGVGVSGTLTTQSASCSPIADIYAAPPTALQACGLSELPLSSVTALPGGGKAYNYTLSDGQTYSLVQPPAGFNPRTASAHEDAAYGVPPAPSPKSPGYANWQMLADGHYATVPQRPYLVVGQPLSSVTSNNLVHK